MEEAEAKPLTLMNEAWMDEYKPTMLWGISGNMVLHFLRARNQVFMLSALIRKPYSMILVIR